MILKRPYTLLAEYDVHSSLYIFREILILNRWLFIEPPKFKQPRPELILTEKLSHLIT
jgi:hypothetical protein